MQNNKTQIVFTNQKYSYTVLKQNLISLKKVYPFLEIGNIGYSVLGKEIPYIRIGKGKNQVLYQGAIHANEWITAVLLMKYIEEFSETYQLKTNIKGYSAHELFNRTSLYLVPMVNPDGVDLVTGNINEETQNYQHYQNIAQNYSEIPFPDGWKANFNGVDLKNYQPVRKVL